MKLRDLDVRNAQPRARAYKLFDGAGLYLEVTPAGGKLWRLKYRFLGTEKRLVLGAYPLVSLKDARAKRDEAKRLLSDGRDPGAAKQAEKARALELAADSFEAIAREWAQRHMADKAQSHSVKVMRRLELYAFPYIGAAPIANLTAPQVLALARRLESRNALETARRVVQNIGQVCRFAITTGRAQTDPTAALRGALRTAPKSAWPRLPTIRRPWEPSCAALKPSRAAPLSLPPCACCPTCFAALANCVPCAGSKSTWSMRSGATS